MPHRSRRIPALLIVAALATSVVASGQQPPPAGPGPSTPPAAGPSTPLGAGRQGPPQPPPPSPAAVERANQLIAEARKAMGGDKLAAVTSILVTGRTRRVRG